MEKARQALRDPKVKALAGVDAFASLLLLVAGVGYLQQKKVLGRGIGNLYALVSLIGKGLSLVLLSDYADSFGIASLIGFIYPVLTLILLNTTFRHDFIR